MGYTRRKDKKQFIFRKQGAISLTTTMSISASKGDPLDQVRPTRESSLASMAIDFLSRYLQPLGKSYQLISADVRTLTYTLLISRDFHIPTL